MTAPIPHGNASREVLVHLNVEVPETDDRDAESIARAVWDAYEVGSDDDRVRELKVVMATAVEV